jgi:hypothetical protein
MVASNVAVLKTKLTRERRGNRRLRAVIDKMREELDLTRHNLDIQTRRLAQLQAEVDLLKAKR